MLQIRIKPALVFVQSGFTANETISLAVADKLLDQVDQLVLVCLGRKKKTLICN